VNLTSCFAKPKTKIHILEAVAKCRVESADLRPRLSAHQHAGSGHKLEAPRFVHRGMVSGESCINVTRITVLANHHARVLDSAVRVQQLAAEHRCLWVSVSVTFKGFEPARLRDRVIVEKDKIFTRGCRGAIVAAFCEATVSWVCHQSHPVAVPGEHLECRVSRGIVHDNDFDIVSDCAQHSFQALASQ
jgi:hypothetical protein